MDRQLTLPSVLEYAARYHGEREIVTRTVEGPIHRYGYADALKSDLWTFRRDAREADNFTRASNAELVR